jgi:hypothetical protein
LATINPELFVKVGVVQVINAGGSIAVVVVVSPTFGSFTAMRKATVWSMLNIWSLMGEGANTGAAFVRTMKLNVVVLDAPLPSVPVRVISVVELPPVGVPEKERVAGSYVMPAGVAEEIIVKLEKSENTLAGRVKFISLPSIKV